MIRCIAIDDEPLALVQLARFIERVPELELVGRFYSADDALRQIESEKIDLIFLDIDMPDCNGVDFARKLGSAAPHIIFTTAYPQYAAEGFRLDAVDYLLKPLSFSELLEAVDKVKRRQRQCGSGESDEECLYVKNSGSVVRLKQSDIVYVKGMGEYVQIKARNMIAPIVTLESMHRLEGLLNGKGFMRIHRSYIINLSYLDKANSNNVEISGEILPVGETYRPLFREYLKSRHL